MKRKTSAQNTIPWGRIVAVLFAVFLVVCLGIAVWTKPDPRQAKLEREKANTAKNIVNDVTELNPVQTQGIVVPHTIDDIVAAVKSHDRVSVGGGRNSMGGQTASPRAIQIDMREYNKVLSFSTTTKEITVQAGIRWRDIQDFVDPYNLSVKIMQTYSNFTVGGSLSVNVHGRYIGLGPLIMSVKSFRIVLADGTVVEASPDKRKDIFYSAIGGMGGIGVISDVTLELADNVNVERSRVKVPTSEYYEFFKKNVRDTGTVLFHNGDMYPPDFSYVSAVSWSVTDKQPTTKDRLIPRLEDYWGERIGWIIISEWPFGRWIREHVIDPLIYRGTPPVHTRNYEASYDVTELEPESRASTSYVLQEYFIPVEHFDSWVPKMKKIFNDNHVNVLNVSIRHAKADPGAKLAWARSESFAFVVYYKQGTDEASRAAVGKWTKQMIEAALSENGTYYLPYQPWATDDQILRAYPGLVDYLTIKRSYDPADKFTNTLWDKYYSDAQYDRFKEREKVFAAASTTKDYFRPFDNAYLSIPEWYIVYSADEYAATLRDSLPSRFDYLKAVRDYWSEYGHVSSLSDGSWHDNSDYKLVLRVIGASFSFENIFKEAYENTVGRISEIIAGGQVSEDRYAASVAKEYADFIYDYPWYDFPFAEKLKGLWRLGPGGSPREMARRFERKMFLSLEYGVKTLYSAVIKAATHAKFGVQDDIVSAVVSRDGGKTLAVISAPHYQPFTRALLSEMDMSYAAGRSFEVLDIAGNESITLEYLDEPGAAPAGKEISRDREFFAIENGREIDKDRIVVETPVKDIYAIYQALRIKGIAIGHLYDY